MGCATAAAASGTACADGRCKCRNAAQVLLASGSVRLLSSGRAAVDGELVPGYTATAAPKHTVRGRLVHARANAIHGLELVVWKLSTLPGLGSEAALALPTGLAAPGGAMEALAAFVQDWPFDGRLAFYRESIVTNQTAANDILREVSDEVAYSLSVMATQPWQALNLGVRLPDAAAAAAGAAAIACMLLQQRELEQRHELHADIARHAAGAAAVLGGAAGRPGCRLPHAASWCKAAAQRPSRDCWQRFWRPQSSCRWQSAAFWGLCAPPAQGPRDRGCSSSSECSDSVPLSGLRSLCRHANAKLPGWVTGTSIGVSFSARRRTRCSCHSGCRGRGAAAAVCCGG